MCNDATAINYNPAGLSLLSKKEIIAQHTEWIADIKHDYVAFAIPLGTIPHRVPKARDAGLGVALSGSAIGASIIYLSQGEMEGRDDTGKLTNSFGASDMAVTLSYARVVNSVLRLGLNTKLIQQRISDESATGIAFDMGVLYKTGLKNTSIGLSVQNIGPQMRFIDEGYDLPLTVAVGAGYNILGTLTLALDIKRSVYDNKTDISIGTEYLPTGVLSLRLGYIRPQTRELAGSNDSIFAYLSGGVGLTISNLTTNYAFVPYGDLGNTHRLSFLIKF